MGSKKQSTVSAQFLPCEACATSMLVVDGHLRPEEGHQVVVSVVDGKNRLTIHDSTCPARLPEDMLTSTATAYDWSLGKIGE